MKFYVEIIAAAALVAVAWAVTHFLLDTGKLECEATHYAANQQAEQQDRTDWLKGTDLSFNDDKWLGSAFNLDYGTQQKLTEASHDLKQRSPAGATAGTPVPNPFAHGWGVCFNAARTGLPQAVAACQAGAANAGGVPGAAPGPDPGH